ncbi:MAG TPA: SAM-dependent methyltransferase [Solirubrobacteraceae bacterium]|jgi:predicted TPR repeat methyltransferase|nr:SAM-dependent methyltransferase [Solirubrobacteraceae bacterium]
MTPTSGLAAHFDGLYERSSDPWSYESSDYEREKYASTLAAVPEGQISTALELGCSIGVFTEQLATRCERVLAIDFSERALALARDRLDQLDNVELCLASFPEQAPAGPWQLIVCSEVLYYLQPPALDSAIAWLAEQLCRGACVLVVSWRGRGVDEPFLGDDVHDRLARELARWHSLDGRRDGYRLDRFDGR